MKKLDSLFIKSLLKANCTKTFASLAIMVLSATISAQVPGSWNPPPNQTTTINAVGIGVMAPVGWQEIQYCDDSQLGLVISNTACPFVPAKYYPVSFDGIAEPVLITNPEPGIGPPVSQTYPTADFTLRQYGTYLNNSKPMIWARTQNNSLVVSQTSGAYTSRFMVCPNGVAGVNIEAPRATFDVKSLGAYNYPGFIVGRQQFGSNNRTQHVMFIPLLANDGYNSISQQYDQGMFFTDGKGANGSNLNGSLVIAPWSTSGQTGGLRMDKDGNVELRGEIQVLNVKTRAIWWPDTVFKAGYDLMLLSDVEKFIALNSHLPNIPSEEQMLENGLSVNEIVPLQMQKIEELTLYSIAQEKQIKVLTDEVELLKKQAEKLINK